MVYPNLDAEMSRHKIEITDISKVLDIAEKTVRNKFNGVSEFKWSQVQLIQKTFFNHLSKDYLFTKDGEQIDQKIIAS